MAAERATRSALEAIQALGGNGYINDTAAGRLLRDAKAKAVRTGRLAREDVCDAHPELVRAAKHVGEPTGRPCPICAEDSLRLVSYVYGEGLKQANGRCLTQEGELESLARRHDDFARYVVEVCHVCRWNHLTRRESHGRLHRDRRVG